MVNITKKYGRYIAMALGLALIVSIFPLTMWGIKAKEANAKDDQDMRIASEISNMTGVTIEEILNLKNQGKTWNEVTDMLRKRQLSNNPDEKDRRSRLLAQTGLEQEFLDKLINEGFKEEGIMQAKLLAERVIFQLMQITSGSENTVEVPKVEVGLDKDKKEDDTALYAELQGKIDIKAAVYLMLKLEKELGSMEKVMDEYLLALQIGVNLEDYIKDREAYQKEKNEKSLGKNMQDMITIEKIEQKMIKRLQDEGAKDMNSTVDQLKADSSFKTTETKDLSPKSPLPDVENPKPENPADKIMDEVKELDPMSKIN